MPRLRSLAALAFAFILTTLRAADDATVLRLSAAGRTISFTAAEFAALPHTTLTVADPHTSAPRTFDGVAVHELLTRIDAPLGDKLRGPALQLAVVFRTKDHYGVVFALADFDAAFSSRTLILADREAGQPLPEKSAPFQLIAPGDKKAARWARMITSIEIVSLAPKL